MGFHFFGLSVKNCPLLWFHCLQGNEGEGQRERGKSSTVWHITKGKRSFPCLSFGCRINWVWKAIEEKKRRGGKKIKRFFSHSPWALGLSFSVPQTTAKIVSPWSLCSEPQCSLEVLVCIVFGLVETRKKKKKGKLCLLILQILVYSSFVPADIYFSNATHAVCGGSIATFSERKRLVCVYSIFKFH